MSASRAIRHRGGYRRRRGRLPRDCRNPAPDADPLLRLSPSRNHHREPGHLQGRAGPTAGRNPPARLGDGQANDAAVAEGLGYPGSVAGGTRALILTAVLGAVAFVSAAALAAPGDPQVSVKKADQAHAKAILLKTRDLPGKGWTASPVDFGRANPSCLVKKFSLGKLTATGQAGTEFGRQVDSGTFLVDSAARVFKTEGQAKQAVAIRSKLGAGKCLGEALKAETPNGSMATSSARVFSVDGLALRSTGYKVTVKVIVAGKTSTLTAVVLNFRSGRTVNELNVLTLDKGWSKATLDAVAAK